MPSVSNAPRTACTFGRLDDVHNALLVPEETVKKRLQRAKRDLADQQVSLDPPEASELIGRLDVVHQVLYLIFNEGYSASQGELAIRSDLSCGRCHPIGTSVGEVDHLYAPSFPVRIACWIAATIFE